MASYYVLGCIPLLQAWCYKESTSTTVLQGTEEETMAGYSNQDGKGEQNRTDGGVNLSGSPFVCLEEVAESMTSGAFVGYIVGYGSGLIKKKGFKGSFSDAGSFAKASAILLGVDSLVKCFLKRLRDKDDAINSGVAGCCVGLVAVAAAPVPAPAPALHALLPSCLACGAAGFIIYELKKWRPALACPLSLSNSVASAHHAVLPPFTLALPGHLLEGFSTFCKSLPKPKRCQWGLPMLEINMTASTSGDGSQHADDLN